MDVTVSEFRAGLASWLDQVRLGEEVLITERGVPVARLLPIDTGSLIEELTQQGLLSKPGSTRRPKATGRSRVPASGSVSEMVSEQRR